MLGHEHVERVQLARVVRLHSGLNTASRPERVVVEWQGCTMSIKVHPISQTAADYGHLRGMKPADSLKVVISCNKLSVDKALIKLECKSLLKVVVSC